MLIGEGSQGHVVDDKKGIKLKFDLVVHAKSDEAVIEMFVQPK